MPRYKYIANRVLTLIQNLALGQRLSEYHTRYPAFSRQLLESLSLDVNSDDFIFDNQMLLQIIYADREIGEITCPTRYAPDSSSNNFPASVHYAFGVLALTPAFCLHRWGWRRSRLFSPLDSDFNE